MSQSQITNDPRLTAYALGELNAADGAAVEQQIGDSVETLLEIDSIREVGSQLRAALQNEPPVARVASSIVKEAPRHRKGSGKFAVVASCLALVAAFGIVAALGRNGQRRVHGISDRFEIADGGVAWTDFDGETNGNGVLAETEFAGPADLYTHTAGSGSRSSQGLAAVESKTHWNMPRGPQVANGDGHDRLYFGEGVIVRGREVRSDEPTPFSAAPQSNQPLTEFDYKRLNSAKPLGQTNGVVTGPVTVAAKVDVRVQALDDSGVFILRGNEKDVEATLDIIRKLEEHKANFSLSESNVKRLQAELLKLEKHQAELKRQSEIRDNQSAEAYAAIHDNPFTTPLQEPLSTFSIDVDTAAYSNMRRFLTQGSWPPADSVRIEELVNYFTYDYTPPGAEISNLKSQISNQESPFAVHLEVAGCPWNAEHRLVRVGLKGKEIALDKRPVSNIVFLIDVSGSMQPANKLPLVKAGLRRLVDQFNENDRVGIVVYAGASGLVLDSTNATQKDVILSAIENLQAGGSTNGGEGIQLAYALARKNFINKGTNRVILCTDGDFNVGITNQDDLTRLIEEEAKSGVFLSVLGFGMGNLKDSTLEKLADKGNGNYAYIDTLKEANKVFVEQMTGTLITIAKDVKIQIEFNPSQVGAYRLIGYENRLLAAQDFRDDTKDAGEIGAGHTVTALYEIIPLSKLPKAETPAAKPLKYQPKVPSPAGAPATDAAALRKYGPATASANAPLAADNSKNEILTIWLRYKQPDADKSDAEIEKVLVDDDRSFAKASTDFRWAASVASFGMILRSSPHKGNATLDSVLELAQSAIGPDKSGYREEFVSLVRSAKALQPQPTK